jgi:hypothetical protein
MSIERQNLSETHSMFQGTTMPTLTIVSKTHGHCTVYFDEQDEELIALRWWYVTKRHKTLYAAAHSKTMQGKKIIIYMHKLLVPYAMIDHHNGNSLDNRQENLRPSTRQENGRNRGKHKDTTSSYKGVCWNKHDKRWRAQITLEGENIYLGGYKDEQEAALVYDAAARKHYGAYANTNFRETPDEQEITTQTGRGRDQRRLRQRPPTR